jgi:hypothetical protein
MRHLIRAGAAVAALAALLTLVTTTALAGGWAEVTMLGDSGDPPVAGEEREIRFSLLQHGVTAVDDGQVNLTAVHPDSGEQIVVSATGLGGGRWAAMVTFPVEGSWVISITHDSLETSAPAQLTVGEAAGLAWLPAALALVAFGAVAAAVAAGIFLARGRSALPARAARAG